MTRRSGSSASSMLFSSIRSSDSCFHPLQRSSSPRMAVTDLRTWFLRVVLTSAPRSGGTGRSPVSGLDLVHHLGNRLDEGQADVSHADVAALLDDMAPGHDHVRDVG